MRVIFFVAAACFCCSTFAQVSKPAQPSSDQKLLQDFFCSEVVYPEKSLKEKHEGTVVLTFVVEQDGKVSDLKVRESVSPEIDAEAIRLFRMILWEPAISLGQPVASAREFDFKFNIKKYNKHCKERGYTITEPPFLPADSSLHVYGLTQVDKAPYPVFDDNRLTLKTFFEKNLRYPETAFRQNLSGKVSLQFVVEPSGRTSNIKVLVPVGGGCTQEAIRLLQLIKWMPGIKANNAVRTLTSLDIIFKLPEDSQMRMFENPQMPTN